MFEEWFMSLIFKPQNGLQLELINQKGFRTPLVKIVRNSMLMSVLNESILKKERRPFIIFSGTHNIKHLDRLFITPLHKKILQEKEVAFYFFEPLTHYLSPIPKGHIPGHILNINNEPGDKERIRSFELDSISEWAKQHNINNLVVYCTDYKCSDHYKSIYKNLKFKTLDLFVVWWSALYKKADNFYIPRKPITKKFWCGAWRYDISRHFIISYLTSQKIHQNSNVSFYFRVSNKELKRRIWMGWKEFEIRHPYISKQILLGNEELQKIVPLSIEIEDPIALEENCNDPGIDGRGKNSRITDSPNNSYQESFCAIVLESRVAQPWPNISEKTLNAIKNKRPFIVVGSAGTLEMIKKMGFKTFDQWWDESYDNIENNIDRLSKICNTIFYINNLELDEINSIYSQMKDILDHNQKNLLNLPKFYKRLNKKSVD